MDRLEKHLESCRVGNSAGSTKVFSSENERHDKGGREVVEDDDPMMYGRTYVRFCGGGEKLIVI